VARRKPILALKAGTTGAGAKAASSHTAALASSDAAVDALSHLGVRHIDMPLTPEKVWQALTDPAFTRRYWDTTLESTWEVGATITWNNHGVVIADPSCVSKSWPQYFDTFGALR